MVNVAISGGGYDTAAEALYGANHVAAAAYDRLRSRLTGYTALGGDDTSSEEFVRTYDPAAQGAVDALRALVDGLGNVGDITAASVRNHRGANAESVYGRARPSYEAGSSGRGAVQVGAVSLPTALGGDNTDVPDWWNHVVDHLQGFGWPSANTDQLRSAAEAWRAAAASIESIPGYLGVAAEHLEQQTSPEISVAVRVLEQTRTDVVELAEVIRANGDACDDYASQVDETRQTVKDLLRDLAIECGVTAGLSAGLSFFTFGGAAAVGAGVIAARAVRYAGLVLAALRGLRAARAAVVLARAAPRLTRLRSSLERLTRARAMVRTFQTAARGRVVGRSALNARQSSNYRRFAKKFGKDVDDPLIRELPDGSFSYTTTVPGRVPGSYAEYTKIVDEAGNTVSIVKTTFAPDGRIVHIKDKF
jgi:hypothetical protein